MDTHLARQLPNDIIIRIIREATVMATMDYWMDIHSRIDTRDFARYAPGQYNPFAYAEARVPAQQIAEASCMSSEFPWFGGDVWALKPCPDGPTWCVGTSGQSRAAAREWGEHLDEDGNEIELDLRFE